MADDTRQGRRRSNRIGTRSSTFKPSQSRSVVRLNQGSSPHSQRTTLPLTQRAGTFGSGRAAGGGAGAGAALAAALAGASVEGPTISQGPPPVETPYVDSPIRLPISRQPNFEPMSPVAAAFRGTFPTFEPQPLDEEDLWKRAGRGYF